MAVDIKAAYRRVLEDAFGKGKVEAYDELCEEGCTFHDPLTGDAGVQEMKQLCLGYRSAFPDLKVTILGSYADGDTTVTHWRMSGTNRGPLLGRPPTGKSGGVEGVTIARFRGGRCVESWAQWDALGMFRQLGVDASAIQAAASQTPGARTHA